MQHNDDEFDDGFAGYPPLLRASFDVDDASLIAELKLLLTEGHDPNDTSPYGETVLRQLFRRGRMDGFNLVLEHGASLADFEWSPLHHAVALGSLDEVQNLADPPALMARDRAYRSPYLLACRLGEVEKAALLRPLTPQDGQICSDEAEGALHMAARGGHCGMLQWLLEQGDDVNQTDEFGGTALLVAVEQSKPGAVKTLLDAGADVTLAKNLSASLGEEPSKPEGLFAKVAALFFKKMDVEWEEPDVFNTPASGAFDAETARLLIKAGVGLEEFDAELLPELTGAALIPKQSIIKEMFADLKERRFGTSNPQLTDNAFYLEQIRTGQSGYSGRQAIMGDINDIEYGTPDWSFQRFGRTITQLADGRWVLIGGEHEDSYDPDFCIYNDVTVLDGKGGVQHYTYPRDLFPPTDFHSATLLGDAIWLIGCLGYEEERQIDKTQVLRLSLKDFSIKKITTTGDNPGWINAHQAVLEGRKIIVSGGKLEPDYRDLEGRYTLNLDTLVWERLCLERDRS